MATSINILEPTLGFGATSGIIKCQVYINNGATQVGQRVYYFSAAEFSAFADSINTNYAALNFGAHALNLSNGDYAEFYYNGGSVASAYNLVASVADFIADNL